jgi:hypothetical protein
MFVDQRRAAKGHGGGQQEQGDLNRNQMVVNSALNERAPRSSVELSEVVHGLRFPCRRASGPDHIAARTARAHPIIAATA